MIDLLFQYIDQIIPILHLLAIAVIITKLIMVLRKKGLSLPAFFSSLFRIYSKNELKYTENRDRIRYMRLNNVLNYYLYTWLLLSIMILIVFGSLY